MDPSESAAGGSARTAIPRFSQLPQPRHKPAPSNDAKPTPNAARNSVIIPPRPTSSLHRYDDPASPQKNNRQSMLMRPGFGLTPVKTLPVSREKELPIVPSVVSTESVDRDNTAVAGETLAARSRRSRPSLSDRTLETLAQIPPSPSPSRRRQSAFYTTESPMRPLSRNATALEYKRPYSRTGDRPYSHVGERPGSPDKRPARSLHAPKSSITRTPAPMGKTTSRLQQPKLMGVSLRSTSTVPSSTTQTLPSKRTTTRSPVKDTFAEKSVKPLGAGVTGVTRIQSTIRPRTSKVTPPNGLKSPVVSNSQDISGSESTQSFTEDRKFQKSSQALRDVIAKAKAVHRSGSNSSNFVPRAAENDVLEGAGINADPATLGLLDSGHVNILKKRINNAKSDGKLNIAALCLTEMPIEVTKMYDPESDIAGGLNWYEMVDVTRLNAADNEFTTLPEDIFPPEDRKIDQGEDYQRGVFAGMQVIDLHGNRLACLPDGFGRLERLTTLNLSKNRLDQSALQIISKITPLKELRLAENSLSGILDESVSCLENLEILDVHANQIEELPSSLGKLAKLKSMDVTNNRLGSLPLEAIFDLPLVEILASKNRLSGSFFPASIPNVPALQNLDVSTNALTALADGKLDLPNIHTLNISFNRVSALPEVTKWKNLVTLNAEENKISEIPVGFASLQKLKYADFNFNSLLQLDDGIGSMDSLTTFRITNNPFRERLLLKLDLQDLKAELRIRSPKPPSQDGRHSDDAGSLTSFSRSPSGDWSSLTTGDTSRFSGISPIPGLSPIERVGHGFSNRAATCSWAVNGDTLDVSNSRLREIDLAGLAHVADQGVKTFNASQNQIQTIPRHLVTIGSALATLDLTNNKLGKAPNGIYMTEQLTLPNLTTLNLTSNALTSLDPLVKHLDAPKLSTLILLFNRLTTLPDICSEFPSLTKLLASNNAIERLDPASVKGLQVLDLSSNELAQLPAKLGLLQGQLRTLMVSGNRFRVPSWGVLEKGTEEILSWCRMKIPEGESMSL